MSTKPYWWDSWTTDLRIVWHSFFQKWLTFSKFLFGTWPPPPHLLSSWILLLNLGMWTKSPFFTTMGSLTINGFWRQYQRKISLKNSKRLIVCIILKLNWKKNNWQASYFQSTWTVENLVRHGEKKNLGKNLGKKNKFQKFWE